MRVAVKKWNAANSIAVFVQTPYRETYLVVLYASTFMQGAIVEYNIGARCLQEVLLDMMCCVSYHLVLLSINSSY